MQPPVCYYDLCRNARALTPAQTAQPRRHNMQAIHRMHTSISTTIGDYMWTLELTSAAQLSGSTALSSRYTSSTLHMHGISAIIGDHIWASKLANAA